MEYQTLRLLLTVYLLGSFVLSISYLRYRRCSTREIALWGTLALVLPVLGPFFVIAARPGPRKRYRQPALANRALSSSKG
jgi:hypothetical protein